MPNLAPIFIANQRTNGVQFAASGAKLQCLWAAGPNGSRIQTIFMSQDDTTTGNMQLWKGTILTDNGRPTPQNPGIPGQPSQWSPQNNSQALPPVLALTNTTNSTITRTNGSFIVDGWNVGMFCAVLGANDNIQNIVAPFHITSIAAGTLTMTGTVFNAASATPPATTQLVKCEPFWSVAAVSGMGMTTVANVNMFSTALGTQLLTVPDSFLTLGPGELILVSYSGTVTANKSTCVTITGGDY